jgi:D-serine deaminase-like pyridoxal phosphate-dependent protein
MSSWIGRPVSFIDTPSLVLDLDIMRRNIELISGACKKSGVNWRPHCKSHKSPDIAGMLIAAGAIGVACAKLSEAEMLVDAGIKDILIANQIVGAFKIDRLMRLRARGDVIVCVDSKENVEMLAAAAAKAGLVLGVLIEVDSGTGRAGVLPGAPVLAFARFVQKFPSLDFTGLMTWEGHTTQIRDQDEKQKAISRAVGSVVESADQCRSNGIPVRIVSCGGTGTFEFSSAVEGITEIQAGGGVLGDVRYCTLYNVPVEYALTVISTVVSRPTDRRVIVDAGKKCMSTDSGMPLPLHLPPVEALRFSAEHGRIDLRSPSETPHVGDRISFVVGYSDTTVHMHNEIFAVRGGLIEQVWEIPRDARLR